MRFCLTAMFQMMPHMLHFPHFSNPGCLPFRVFLCILGKNFCKVNHAFAEKRHGLVRLYKPLFQFIAASLLLMNAGITFSQESEGSVSFGIHPGFNVEHFAIDRCKTYLDSTTHILFNPCYDFRNRGVYSSYFARSNFLGNCPACDSVLVVLPRMAADIDWENLNRQQKEAWDYYLKLWQQRDKLERYYIDLEGVLRGAMTGPIR